jgi:hypothetical protein
MKVAVNEMGWRCSTHGVNKFMYNFSWNPPKERIDLADLSINERGSNGS